MIRNGNCKFIVYLRESKLFKPKQYFMKPNLNLIFAILSLILISQKSFCQENYLDGQVVTLNGDSLQGFIDYRNWEKNPSSINFKTKLSGTSTVYSSNDIKSFQVKNEVYIGATVKIEVSPYQLHQLDENPKFSYETITCFLQTIICGEKGLYFYKTQNGKEYFYIKEDSGYSLLGQKKYIKMQRGKRIVFENKRYVGQLALYLNDCPKIKNRINTLEYTKISLRKLFKNYYSLSQKNIEFEHKKEKLIAEAGVIAGLSISSLNLGGASSNYIEKANFNSSIDPAIGFFVDVTLPRNQGRISIYNELLLTTYKFKGVYDIDNSFYSTYETELGVTSLKLNMMARYKYPIGKAFLFGNAGVGSGFTISETNKMVKNLKSLSFENTNSGKALSDTRKHEMGILLGLGGMYKRSSFEVRYETSNGMSDFTSLSSKVNRVYFMLGYKF